MEDIMKSKRFQQSILTGRLPALLLIITLWLIALMMSPVAFAGGRVEHHQITSKILADEGEVAERELSVYLPEEYDTSELAYPVLYLLHGGWGIYCGVLCTNREFVEYYGIATIADRLIENGKIQPLIIVSPDLQRKPPRYPYPRFLPSASEYLAQEIILFVGEHYRTIPNREGRAISGHSDGGSGAFYIGIDRPDVFFLVGSLDGFNMERSVLVDLINSHHQNLSSSQFWILGMKGGNGLGMASEIIESLEKFNLSVTTLEHDGTHLQIERGLEENLMFFSEHLGGGIVAVSPHGKLATTWGEMKHSR